MADGGPILPWPLLPPALAIVFGAGIVRGFSGFGFSALCVAALSLLLPPAQVVPPIFVLEIVASVTLLRCALRDADWPWLGWLLLGNALLMPLGIALLAHLSEVALRALIGALLLAAALLLRSGVRLALEPTHGVRLATGLVSGFANGVAAIGGIAVVLLLNQTALAPAAMRGTMIVLLLITDLYALACAALIAGGTGGEALVGGHTLRASLWLAPAMLAGIWVGQRAFAGVSPERFRRIVPNLLTAIAALTVLRAAAALA
jgi:hypothetical protein